jgi:hypothetical protein
VHNVDELATVNTKLDFGQVTDLTGNLATNINQIVVDLGELHALWVEGGRLGEHVTDGPCGNDITIEPIGGWIGNIQLPADAMEVLHVAAIPPTVFSTYDPFQFTLKQFAVGFAGQEDQFIGGEVFQGRPCQEPWPIPLPEGDGEFEEGGGGGAPKPSVAHGKIIPQEGINLVFSVRPNPASSVTTIRVEELPEGIPAVLQIFNQLGEVVATLYDATPSAEFGLAVNYDCSHLSNGTYYARIQSGAIRNTLQFIVQH